MSYSGRRRYKSRREKNRIAGQRGKAILAALGIGLFLYVVMNWVSIRDYLATYFY